MKNLNILICLIILVANIKPVFASQKLIFTSIENSSFTNFAMSVLTEAYQRIGYKIGNKPMPAKRTLFMANTGVGIDGELFRIEGIENEYTNLLPIIVPLHQSKWMVLTKNKKIEVNGWDSLQQYKIGIRRGVSTTKEGTKGFDIQVVNSNIQLFELLERDRVDAIIISKGNANKVLNDLNITGVQMMEPPVHINNVYHFIHKKINIWLHIFMRH
ncbi:hypothetical protein ACLKMH_08545 [Psychromonas sp. KJ10-10]|uniref:hypothetical protein n=1 Tax=Psychromonas sp. KJ10-10 TaxID=3391823 RepID=UPI0039B4CF28